MTSPPPVTEWDARIKILLALVFGVLTWRTGWPGLALYAAALAYLAATLSGFLDANRRAARAFIIFAAIWTAVKFGLDLWQGAGAPAAVQNSLLLGARLIVVLLIALVLAQSTSSRRLGLALSWLLRPVLGGHAWKAALSLALMIHFLPLVWFASDAVATGLKARGPGISRKRRMIVFPTALLARLANTTWSQTVAVAARGLDRPEAWRSDFNAPAVAWIAALIVAAAGLAASYL
jgi:biotin transport system permease protein